MIFCLDFLFKIRRKKHEGVLLVSCVCTTVWESYRCEILKPTLKRMSVHIAFPWVIIGSWSSPFPSQQSSSTHLEAQSDYNTEPLLENQHKVEDIFSHRSEHWMGNTGILWMQRWKLRFVAHPSVKKGLWARVWDWLDIINSLVPNKIIFRTKLQ